MSEPTESDAKAQFDDMTQKCEEADKERLPTDLVTTTNTYINEQTTQVEREPIGGKRHTLHKNLRTWRLELNLVTLICSALGGLRFHARSN